MVSVQSLRVEQNFSFQFLIITFFLIFIFILEQNKTCNSAFKKHGEASMCKVNQDLVFHIIKLKLKGITVKRCTLYIQKSLCCKEKVVTAMFDLPLPLIIKQLSKNSFLLNQLYNRSIKNAHRCQKSYVERIYRGSRNKLSKNIAEFAVPVA